MFRSGMQVQHTIAPSRRPVRIGQEAKAVAEPLCLTMINLDRIDADPHHLDTASGEIAESLLKTPQLGVTEGSPMATIKDQDSAIWGQQIRQRDSFPVLVRQRKSRCPFSDARRFRRIG